jgi:type II secretion system protein G
MKQNKGFTLVEIMIVVAIIGLLAAIAIPSFMRARTTSQKNSCINNLRQIEAAKDQYALDNGLTNNATIAAANVDCISNLVSKTQGYIKQYPMCPASTNYNQTATADLSSQDYTVNAIGVNATCVRVSATHVLSN